MPKRFAYLRNEVVAVRSGRSGTGAVSTRRPCVALAALVIGVILAACGGADGVAPTTAPSVAETPATTPVAPSPPEPLTVTAGFYPLAFLAQRVGGDQVVVTNLTPPGGDSHDLELGPRQVADVEAADLVLLIPGFMPALDQAAESRTAGVIDVAGAVELIAGDDGHDHDAGDEKGHDHGDEKGHDHGDEKGHDHGPNDPHIWLDPMNMSAMAGLLAEQFSAAQPASAELFTANAQRLQAELSTLDKEWRDGTAQCRNRDLVTAHEAFGYLARRYDFTQRGITGLSPEAEPSPRKAAEIADYVRANGVETIYYEVLVDPAIAKAIASETGARTATLDPIESLAADSSEDYLSIMRANLRAVQVGNGCS